MNADDFFHQIEHIPTDWNRYRLHVPLFYEDIRYLAVFMLAPIKNIKRILPSNRLKPYRITPWHGVITISAFEYRKCDIGPYNEVSIGAPVTIDEDTPIFTGIIRGMPKETMVYSRHLPVTTEYACDLGVTYAGYPKFLADIAFTEESNWVTCGLKADSQNILMLRGRKIDLQMNPRVRMHHITYRKGYLLRSEIVFRESEFGESRNKEDVTLDLGEHQIARELKELKLGRVLGYRYCPRAQAILTPVIESFAGKQK